MFTLGRALPVDFRAGDNLSRPVQTQLLPGAGLFIVATVVLNGTPSRVRLGGGEDGVYPVQADGSVLITADSAATKEWLAGRYKWSAFSVVDGKRREIMQGTLNVLPDLDGDTAVDPRSEDEKLLDQVRALIGGRALDDVQMYKIGGRELTKMTRAELREWEAELARRVYHERVRRGEKVKKRAVGIRFGGGL